jgi:hypothetical protein
MARTATEQEVRRMRRKEVNERSPLRVLEQSIRGGLGPGKIGVIVARHGLGKMAFLVGVALDDLMRGRNVLHVSLEYPVDKIVAYYDEIFGDLARDRELVNVWQVRMDMERSRRIHSYPDGVFSVSRLRDALGFYREHTDFIPTAIMIDHYDFDHASSEDLDGLHEVAREIEGEIWMSAVTSRDAEVDEQGIPAPVSHVKGAVDVILRMAHDGNHVHISLLKDHDNPAVPDLRLALDPTTLLLVRE